jgi:hypothetical protein
LLETATWGLIALLAFGQPGGAPAAGASPPPAAPAAAPAEPTATSPSAYRDEEPPSGIGFLVAGPLTVGVGIPLAFLANDAWRSNCGPSNSNVECARGSTLSALGHTGAGLAFTAGVVFTGVGGHRLGMRNAENKWRSGIRPNPRNGALISGAVLLPASVLAFGFVRLFYWLPTPDCETAACVRNLQTQSTSIVSACALGAAAGGGLLMYGLGFNKSARGNRASLDVAPFVGPGIGGLGFSGRF